MFKLINRGLLNVAMQQQSTRSFAAMAKNLPAQKCYYGILGVEHTATPEQIKEAYRAAVKMYHPDVAGSSAPDSEKFRNV